MDHACLRAGSATAREQNNGSATAREQIKRDIREGENKERWRLCVGLFSEGSKKNNYVFGFFLS